LNSSQASRIVVPDVAGVLESGVRFRLSGPPSSSTTDRSPTGEVRFGFRLTMGVGATRASEGGSSMDFQSAFLLTMALAQDVIP